MHVISTQLVHSRVWRTTVECCASYFDLPKGLNVIASKSRMDSQDIYIVVSSTYKPVDDAIGSFLTPAYQLNLCVE
jgi:hypothetical protein